MVVDDARFVLVRISGMISGAGHTVVTASDGKEAVELFKKESPELTFMDVNMPEMDGLEALTEIKKLDASAKVIMLTNDNQKETIMKAKTLKADGFLVKPVTEEVIFSQIKKLAE